MPWRVRSARRSRDGVAGLDRVGDGRGSGCGLDARRRVGDRFAEAAGELALGLGWASGRGLGLLGRPGQVEGHRHGADEDDRHRGLEPWRPGRGRRRRACVPVAGVGARPANTERAHVDARSSSVISTPSFPRPRESVSLHSDSRCHRRKPVSITVAGVAGVYILVTFDLRRSDRRVVALLEGERLCRPVWLTVPDLVELLGVPQGEGAPPDRGPRPARRPGRRRAEGARLVLPGQRAPARAARHARCCSPTPASPTTRPWTGCSTEEEILGTAPIDALRAGRKAEVRRVAQALGLLGRRLSSRAG